MANYHIGRLTMDCILAERFQKFVHIENFVNSIYKSFKFIIGTYNDDDTLPGKSFFHKTKGYWFSLWSIGYRFESHHMLIFSIFVFSVSRYIWQQGELERFQRCGNSNFENKN